MYRDVDFVFLSKIPTATFGISVPSETILHEHKTSTDPSANPCIAVSLSLLDILPSTTFALYPAFTNLSQVTSACLTDTQKAIAGKWSACFLYI